jgi:hypothetical protein
MTWKCNSNEASEYSRKEGYKSSRTRHTTITDSPGEVKDSFSSPSYDRSKASSEAISPHREIQSFLFQMRVSSPFLKVIQ